MSKVVIIDVQEAHRGKEVLVFRGSNNVTYNGKNYVVDAVPELVKGKHVHLRLFNPNNRLNGSLSLTGIIVSVN